MASVPITLLNKAIAAIYDDMICNKDSRLITCSLFLDLSKSFDSVDHNILLEKVVLLWSKKNTPKSTCFLLKEKCTKIGDIKYFLMQHLTWSSGLLLGLYYSLYIF